MLTLTQTWPHRDRYTHMSKAGGVGEEDALFKVLTLANHKGESVTCQGDSKQETRKGQDPALVRKMLGGHMSPQGRSCLKAQPESQFCSVALSWGGVFLSTPKEGSE